LRDSELSLLLIDFDGLKGVNDALGYDRGDALIAAVGMALAANVNEGELAARLGGDEFVVVLPEAMGACAEAGRGTDRGARRVAVPGDLEPSPPAWARRPRCRARIRERCRRAVERCGAQASRKTDRDVLAGRDPLGLPDDPESPGSLAGGFGRT
jgi:GGDEF domain-containing protein